MKIFILLSLFLISSYVRSQEPTDSLNIVMSYSEGDKYFKIYHNKDDNHFEEMKKIHYPEDPYTMINLSSEEYDDLDNAIIHSLSQEKLIELKGKRILFSFRINGQGHINSTQIMIPKQYHKEVDFTKKECKQLMHQIKKDVKFDVDGKCKDWGDFFINIYRKIY